MFIVFIAAAALAAAVAVCALVLLVRCRRLHRVLARERAAHRLMAGCLYRDMQVFRARIEAVALERAVVEEAGRVLEAALVSHSQQSRVDPSQEGGPA